MRTRLAGGYLQAVRLREIVPALRSTASVRASLAFRSSEIRATALFLFTPSPYPLPRGEEKSGKSIYIPSTSGRGCSDRGRSGGGLLFTKFRKYSLEHNFRFSYRSICTKPDDSIPIIF